jgi:hypothetical protein
MVLLFLDFNNVVHLGDIYLSSVSPRSWCPRKRAGSNTPSPSGTRTTLSVQPHSRCKYAETDVGQWRSWRQPMLFSRRWRLLGVFMCVKVFFSCFLNLLLRSLIKAHRVTTYCNVNIWFILTVSYWQIPNLYWHVRHRLRMFTSHDFEYLTSSNLTIYVIKSHDII